MGQDFLDINYVIYLGLHRILIWQDIRLNSNINFFFRISGWILDKKGRISGQPDIWSNPNNKMFKKICGSVTWVHQESIKVLIYFIFTQIRFDFSVAFSSSRPSVIASTPTSQANTKCLRSSDSFYIVSYYIKWVTTS